MKLFLNSEQIFHLFESNNFLLTFENFHAYVDYVETGNDGDIEELEFFYVDDDGELCTICTLPSNAKFSFEDGILSVGDHKIEVLFTRKAFVEDFEKFLK